MTSPEPVSRRTAASPAAIRWTDEHGVTTWTDRFETVPERYRAQAESYR
jgi:hypothetical protein